MSWFVWIATDLSYLGYVLLETPQFGVIFIALLDLVFIMTVFMLTMYYQKHNERKKVRRYTNIITLTYQSLVQSQPTRFADCMWCVMLKKQNNLFVIKNKSHMVYAAFFIPDFTSRIYLRKSSIGTNVPSRFCADQ